MLKLECYLVALNRIQKYENWIVFSTEKLDKLLIKDSEL